LGTLLSAHFVFAQVPNSQRPDFPWHRAGNQQSTVSKEVERLTKKFVPLSKVQRGSYNPQELQFWCDETMRILARAKEDANYFTSRLQFERSVEAMIN